MATFVTRIVSSPHCLEAPWLNPMELACLRPVHKVFLGSRKLSTVNQSHLSGKVEKILDLVYTERYLTYVVNTPIHFRILTLSETAKANVSFIRVHLATVLVFTSG